MQENEKETGYCWFIEATAIAFFENFEEAKQNLEKQPKSIEILIGDKKTYVCKEEVYIAPL